MNFMNKQNNIRFVNHSFKQSGFTIIEALVAIFILSFAITSLLDLTTSSIMLAKYTNNDITANYLLQESIDSIRNSRDTLVFQRNSTGAGWSNFLSRYNKCLNGNTCYLKMESFNPADSLGSDVLSCPNTSPSWGTISCPVLNYDKASNPAIFYSMTGGSPSNFKRKVNMTLVNGNEVKVTVMIEWKNGTAVKSKSLGVSLLNWQE